MTDDQPTTQELKAIQVQRLDAERDAVEGAEEVGDDAAERAHGRRADKAAYLAEKLDEQAEALDQ